MEKSVLQQILDNHKKWLSGDGGERADLQETDLRNANLREVDLRNANLREVDLRNADLWEADLRWADLRKADLRDADFQCADLQCANLQCANLQCADLWEADLRNANLRNANLREVDLRNADLRGADLQGANLWKADLQNANLREADLSGSAIEFWELPAKTIASLKLGSLPEPIMIQLMLRDAEAFFPPRVGRERFMRWAHGGECPLVGTERLWFFTEDRNVLKRYLETFPANHMLSDHVWTPTIPIGELTLKICEYKGWGIRGILDCKNINGDNNGKNSD